MSYSPTNPWTFPFNSTFPLLPAQKIISSITQAFPCVVTTSTNHGYSTGQQVRIVFPFPYGKSFGMYQINGKAAVATVLDSTSFSLPIDTRVFNAFSIGTTLQNAQVLPIGGVSADASSDFEQTNPVNNQNLIDVPIYQRSGLQGSAGTYRP
jgi:hypothetical protein